MEYFGFTILFTLFLSLKYAIIKLIFHGEILLKLLKMLDTLLQKI